MSAALLERLESLGVRLTLEQDRLKVDAPKGVLTPELRAELVSSKPALLQALQSPLLPEPLEPSPLWLEAISKAQALDPARAFVVRVGLGDDPDFAQLARLAEPGQVVSALRALSLRYPRADWVEVCKTGTLEVVMGCGVGAVQRFEGGGEPPKCTVEG